ncbi:MAG: hypothetical protein PHN47_04725 [Clostridia bacterium]|nr:hypothetical protein [Clostridia bacterium]MDD4571770.1 hypothetical protein [Clostridia bacterium]
MIKPSGKQIKKMTKDYSIIPICKKIYAVSITTIKRLRKLAPLSKSSYLPESIEGVKRWGCYSFLGFGRIGG